MPSGPEAFNRAIFFKATSTSCLKIFFIKLGFIKSDTTRGIVARTSSRWVGLDVEKCPLKYSWNSPATWSSPSHHSPFSFLNLFVQFRLNLWEALLWKYLVFWSPSFSQCSLERCYQIFSSLVSKSLNSALRECNWSTRFPLIASFSASFTCLFFINYLTSDVSKWHSTPLT